MLRPTSFFDSSQWSANTPKDWRGSVARVELGPVAQAALGAPGEDDPAVSYRAWRLIAPCGLQLLLEQSARDDIVEFTNLYVQFRSELEHALMHLPSTRCSDTAGVVELKSGWELSRLDDNGQQFVIGHYPRRASADCVASLLSVGKHKQTYSVRLVEPLPLMVSDVGEWELWRRDDSGNAFLVTRHLTRGHAQMQLEALEAEPRHKQVYWLEHKPRNDDGGAHR